MSTINACFQALPLDPASGPAARRGDGPVHCATEMEIVVPALGCTTVDYTFEPEEDPVRLPPVWRCSCGFQFDAWATSWTEQAVPLTPEQRLPLLAGTVPA